MDNVSAQHVTALLFFKNRLQEHTQKLSLPLPVYETVSEGTPHVPCFRSTVTVNGVRYTSNSTFHHRKEAEQDAARIALENLPFFASEVPNSLIQEMFCKSIANEFAAKKKMPLPTYTTTQLAESVPVFTSYLSFDGKMYGEKQGRNKKEAEQLAACSFIDSMKGDSSMMEVLRSKAKMAAGLKLDSFNINESRAALVTPLATVPNDDAVEKVNTLTANKPIHGALVESTYCGNCSARATISQHENRVAHKRTAGAECGSSSVLVVANQVGKKKHKKETKPQQLRLSN